MRAKSFTLAVVLLLTPATVVRAIDFPPSDGEVGVRLVGTWDIRGVGTYTRQSTLQIINPGKPLLVDVWFFDDTGTFVGDHIRPLVANDLWELNVNTAVAQFPAGPTFGVVQINTLTEDSCRGVVAYKKELFIEARARGLTGPLATPLAMSETRLQPVPVALVATMGVPSPISCP